MIVKKFNKKLCKRCKTGKVKTGAIIFIECLHHICLTANKDYVNIALFNWRINEIKVNLKLLNSL